MSCPAAVMPPASVSPCPLAHCFSLTAPPPPCRTPFTPLQTQREHITSKECRAEVRRQMAREGEDIRFDHALARDCHA